MPPPGESVHRAFALIPNARSISFPKKRRLRPSRNIHESARTMAGARNRIGRPASFQNPGQRLAGLLAKIVQHGGLMNAGYGAKRRAAFGTRRFTPQVFHRVLFQRNPWLAPLLGAVMHQASSQMYRNRPPARHARRSESLADVLLKAVEMGERE